MYKNYTNLIIIKLIYFKIKIMKNKNILKKLKSSKFIFNKVK